MTRAIKGFHDNNKDVPELLNAIKVGYDTFKSSLEHCHTTSSSESKDEFWKNGLAVYGDAQKCSALVEMMQDNLKTLENELEKPLAEGGNFIRSAAFVLKGLGVLLDCGSQILVLANIDPQAGLALAAVGAFAKAVGKLFIYLANSELSPSVLASSEGSLYIT